MVKKIEVGTRVKWTSQSGSYETAKVGEVVHVLPAGTPPLVTFTSGPMRDMEVMYGAKAQGGTFLARKHESYIVLVRDPKRPKATPKLYWPLVTKLRVTNAAVKP